MVKAKILEGALPEGRDFIQLSEDVFSVPFNTGLVHQVVVHSIGRRHRCTKSHKNRGSVSGGGRKPWRQKGTGNARAGSIRSPLWVGGGKTFVRNHPLATTKINKKMYRLAMACIFSELARRDMLYVLDGDKLVLEKPSTKWMVSKIKNWGLEKTLLILDAEGNANIHLSTRNIPGVEYCEVKNVGPESLVNAEAIAVTYAGLRKIEQDYS